LPKVSPHSSQPGFRALTRPGLRTISVVPDEGQGYKVMPWCSRLRSLG
jgi:hypothetical protein